MSNRPRPLKALGMAFGAVYALGTWIYGTWYVWEHWAGYWSFGTLAWYGFMRAPSANSPKSMRFSRQIF